MNFLNAAEVYTFACNPENIYTHTLMEQNLYELRAELDLTRAPLPEALGIIISYDEKHKAPKKLSISLNQHRMRPMEMTIQLIQNNVVYHEEFAAMCNILQPLEDTTEIRIVLKSENNEGKKTNMLAIINYMQMD